MCTCAYIYTHVYIYVNVQYHQLSNVVVVAAATYTDNEYNDNINNHNIKHITKHIVYLGLLLRPGEGGLPPVQGRNVRQAFREFMDVVFEDVLFDNNSVATNCYGKVYYCCW